MAEDPEISLRAYIERIIDERQIQLQQSWEAHRREHALLHDSLTLARDEMTRKLETMNEFRRQIEQAELKYVTRSEWSAQHNSLETQARNTQTQVTEQEARSLKMDFAETVDKRIRSVEKLVYIASGAVMIIAFLLNWIRK
jgi:hypothetical protein